MDEDEVEEVEEDEKLPEIAEEEQAEPSHLDATSLLISHPLSGGFVHFYFTYLHLDTQIFFSGDNELSLKR